MGKAIKLVIVRHGQSEGNRDSIIQGITDSPLTELGVAQAKECGRRLSQEYRDHHIHGFYASPLQRAHRTAKELANEFQVRRLSSDQGRTSTECKCLHTENLRIMSELRENDMGSREGVGFGAIPRRGQQPAEKRKGDSLSAIILRANSVVSLLLSRHMPCHCAFHASLRSLSGEIYEDSEMIPACAQQQDAKDHVVVLVTHGAFTRALLRSIAILSDSKHGALMVPMLPNAGHLVVRIDCSQGRRSCTLLREPQAIKVTKPLDRSQCTLQSFLVRKPKPETLTNLGKRKQAEDCGPESSVKKSA